MADTYWDVTNPLKPVGLWDGQAELDIPFKWTDWLTPIGASIADFEVTCQSPLEIYNESEAGGIVVPFVRVAAGQSLVVGQKYWVKCRITTSGAVPREDERTVWLKIVER